MTKKGLLAICAAVAVAGGAGSAIAAGAGALGSTKPTDDAWVQALAKKLGTTPDKLVEALKGVSNDRIDALVAAGTITRAQADTLKARVEATGGLGLRGGFGPSHGFGHGGLGGGPGFGHRGGFGGGMGGRAMGHGHGMGHGRGGGMPGSGTSGPSGDQLPATRAYIRPAGTFSRLLGNASERFRPPSASATTMGA